MTELTPKAAEKHRNRQAEIAAHPVALAVAPLKAEAVIRAGQEATKFANRIHDAFKAAGWDLEAAYPWPATTDRLYREKVAMRNVAQSMTKPDEDKNRTTRRRGEPYFVIWSASGMKRFVEQSERDAAFDYECFVYKLVGKIGMCVSATITGSHVWGSSILAVQKVDGVEVYGERWKTTTIINVSKYGKLFNQWPSRKMKG